MNSTLRTRAEALLAQSPVELPSLQTRDVQALIHEFQVYQAELEIQNEELRRTQQELVESRDRYLELYQSVPVGCLTLDVQRTIRDVNAAAAVMLAGRVQGLVGQRLDKFVAAADADACYLLLRQAVATGSRQRQDIQLRRGDGSSFWTDMQVIPVNPPGPAATLRLTLSDIGERKRAEAALQQAASELQAVNATLQASHRAALNLMEDALEARQEMERANAKLLASEERYRGLVEQAVDGIFLADAHGHYLDVNAAGAAMLGYARENVLRLSIVDVIAADEGPRVAVEVGKFAGGAVVRSEWQFRRQDGTTFPGEVVGRQLPDGRLLAIVRDIAERKQAEQERELAVEFLHLVNAAGGTADLVQATTGFFHRHSGCEAVGLRLQQGDDYPYAEARGFPAEFIRLENSLCDRDAAGDVRRDSAGSPCLDCMCGNVICGRFDPAQPFFSSRGSFWTNSTTALLAATSAADRQARTRNRCHGEGYESVALIALRVGGERLGLLQLNDRRKGCFTAGAIALWERLAGYLAVALAKTQAEEALRESNQDLLRMNHAMEGRELRMIELKQEVNDLCARAGQPARYALDFEKEGAR